MINANSPINQYSRVNLRLDEVTEKKLLLNKVVTFS